MTEHEQRRLDPDRRSVGSRLNLDAMAAQYVAAAQIHSGSRRDEHPGFAQDRDNGELGVWALFGGGVDAGVAHHRHTDLLAPPRRKYRFVASKDPDVHTPTTTPPTAKGLVPNGSVRPHCTTEHVGTYARWAADGTMVW